MLDENLLLEPSGSSGECFVQSAEPEPPRCGSGRAVQHSEVNARYPVRGNKKKVLCVRVCMYVCVYVCICVYGSMFVIVRVCVYV